MDLKNLGIHYQIFILKIDKSYTQKQREREQEKEGV